MNIPKTAVWFGIAVLTAGCARSLHTYMMGATRSANPLAAAETELASEPQLAGTWVEKGGTSALTFEVSEDNTYKLVYTEEENSAEFHTGLVRLGESQFLNVLPGETELGNDVYILHLLPVTTFFRIEIDGDVLRLAGLNQSWLERMIARNELDIAYQRLDDGTIVITSPTEELREFVEKCAEDPAASSAPISLYRQE